jgi:phosphoenolpyruvate carboxykinase (ATP)
MNVSKENGDVTLFFSLSSTSKTMPSADPNHLLISNDKHVWSDTGAFNIEGSGYEVHQPLHRKGAGDLQCHLLWLNP